MGMRQASDSSLDRAVRMLRELSPGERMEAAAYAVAIELRANPRRSLEGLLMETRARVREIQAGARP